MRLDPDERRRVFAAVAAERRSIADLVDGLDDDQLATPSLCEGWDVKTVAGHLVSDFTDGFGGFLASGIRHGGVNRGIDALARRRADHELSPPLTGPLSGLTDVLVHGADIRIPLGLRYEPNPRHAARVLDFLTGPTQAGFFPRRRLRGIGLHGHATGRRWGVGESIDGSEAALVLAVCGRTVALANLTGPGVATLRERLGG